jgi:hypothetical protein
VGGRDPFRVFEAALATAAEKRVGRGRELHHKYVDEAASLFRSQRSRAIQQRGGELHAAVGAGQKELAACGQREVGSQSRRYFIGAGVLPQTRHSRQRLRIREIGTSSIRARKPALCKRHVPRPEEVQPCLGVSFFRGALAFANVVIRRLLPVGRLFRREHLNSAFDHGLHSVLSRAAAKCPVHSFANLRIRGFRIFVKQRLCCRYLAVLTETALRNLLIDPGLLQRMEVPPSVGGRKVQPATFSTVPDDASFWGRLPSRRAVKAGTW